MLFENEEIKENIYNAVLDKNTIQQLSKVNVQTFKHFKDNMKKGIFPPIAVDYDENTGFSSFLSNCLFNLINKNELFEYFIVAM